MREACVRKIKECPFNAVYLFVNGLNKIDKVRISSILGLISYKNKVYLQELIIYTRKTSTVCLGGLILFFLYSTPLFFRETQPKATRITSFCLTYRL